MPSAWELQEALLCGTTGISVPSRSLWEGGDGAPGQSLWWRSLVVSTFLPCLALGVSQPLLQNDKIKISIPKSPLTSHHF